MDFLKKALAYIQIIETTLLLLFVVIDNVLIVLAKIKNPVIDNDYYNFHRKHGFIKITGLKFILIAYVIYSTVFERTGHSGGLSLIATAFYGVMVITFLIDYSRRREK